ncbi:MAG: DUF4097 family beta strand repeat-containing protein [Bacteroidetes bacterium]|nr:DUF4097 family beta strand repeat-containing protein [Bacteroidota bacterium]
MKTRRFKLWLAAALIIFFPGWKSFAASEKFTKNIKKEFTVNSDALLSVKNKYGKIHCNNWEKMAVSVEVTISVEAGNEQKAQRIFDHISIDISGSNAMVKAETSISENWSGKDDSQNFSIDYEIYMPKSLEVALDNKFGDIFIDQVEGPLTIDLSYGNMEANRIQNTSNTLSIKFSDAVIKYMKSGKVELKYSELTLAESGDLKLDTKFSTVNIDVADVAGVMSQYDTYKIGKVNLLNSDSKFSDIEIETLNVHGELESQYGDIEIGYIPSSFNDIIINNRFGDVQLNFSRDANYLVNATIKFGSLEYPKNLSKISVREEDYVSTTYKGYVGSQSDPRSIVKIESTNASVILKAE